MTTEEEYRNFLEIIRPICSRPAMYVGYRNIRLVATLIQGISWGQNITKYGGPYFQIGGGDAFRNFPEWLMDKYAIYHSGWGWYRVLYHEFDHSHQDAIKAITTLYEEYLEDREAFSQRDLSKSYDELWNAPNCDCKNWHDQIVRD